MQAPWGQGFSSVLFDSTSPLPRTVPGTWEVLCKCVLKGWISKIHLSPSLIRNFGLKVSELQKPLSEVKVSVFPRSLETMFAVSLIKTTFPHPLNSEENCWLSLALKKWGYSFWISPISWALDPKISRYSFFLSCFLHFLWAFPGSTSDLGHSLSSCQTGVPGGT